MGRIFHNVFQSTAHGNSAVRQLTCLAGLTQIERVHEVFSRRIYVFKEAKVYSNKAYHPDPVFWNKNTSVRMLAA